MSDIADLQIRVHSLEVATANRRLDTLERTGGRAERATDGLTKAFSRLAVGALAVGASMAFTKGLVDTQREFDRINASLVTITGSTDRAAVAFQAIQAFANNTPYDLAQVSNAFVKLSNYGLDPSVKAMTSYGNTAAAMGKNLDQMIEAVADATTMQFERLKEFGIKANAQGTDIKFTFKGVTTSVAKDSQAIQEYLLKLGNTDFAGAMEKRMDTLDGAMSNLGDAWSKLQLSVSAAGLGKAIENEVRLATAALNDLTAMVSSGQMGAYFVAFIQEWATWEHDVIIFVNNVAGYFGAGMGDIRNESTATVTWMVSAFQQFPANVKAFIQIMVTEVLAGFDKAKAYATAFKDYTKAIFTNDTFKDVSKRLEDSLKSVDSVRLSSIDSILAERKAAVDSFDIQIQKAQQLRKEYDLAQLPTQGAANDPLAQFNIGSTTPKVDSTDAVAKLDKQDTENASKKLQDLQDQLQSENDAVQQAFEDRLFIIEDAFQLGLVSQQEYLKLREHNEVQFQAKLGNIEAQGALQRRAFEEKTAKQKTKTILGEMVTMTQGVAQQNKAMFEINKQAAAANALISTYESFTRTLAAYPYPFNIVLAGLSLAAGLAQVSAIESTSFQGGGGGTTPSAAGTSPTMNSTPTDAANMSASASSQDSTKYVSITLTGAGYSKEDVRALIGQINEEVGDGVELKAATG